jgi:hypothetical protein
MNGQRVQATGVERTEGTKITSRADSRVQKQNRTRGPPSGHGPGRAACSGMYMQSLTIDYHIPLNQSHKKLSEGPWHKQRATSEPANVEEAALGARVSRNCKATLQMATVDHPGQWS